jgi:hypothetical protein
LDEEMRDGGITSVGIDVAASVLHEADGLSRGASDVLMVDVWSGVAFGRFGINEKD